MDSEWEKATSQKNAAPTVDLVSLNVMKRALMKVGGSLFLEKEPRSTVDVREREKSGLNGWPEG